VFTAVKVESCNTALAVEVDVVSAGLTVFLQPVVNEILTSRMYNPFCRFRFMGISVRVKNYKQDSLKSYQLQALVHKFSGEIMPRDKLSFLFSGIDFYQVYHRHG
jgi:hypothetical protein